MSDEKKQQFATLACTPDKRPTCYRLARRAIYQTTSYVFQTQTTPDALRSQGIRQHLHRIMNRQRCVREARGGSRRRRSGLARLQAGGGDADLTTCRGGRRDCFDYSLYGARTTCFTTRCRAGITVRFVDADDFDGLRAAINEKTGIYTMLAIQADVWILNWPDCA